MADISRPFTKVGQVLAPVTLAVTAQTIEFSPANPSFGKASGTVVLQADGNWLISNDGTNYFPVASGVPFALLLPGTSTVYVKSAAATPTLSMFVGA